MHAHTVIIGRQLNVGSEVVSSHVYGQRWELWIHGRCGNLFLHMLFTKPQNIECSLSHCPCGFSMRSGAQCIKAKLNCDTFECTQIAIDIIINFQWFLKLQKEEQDRTPLFVEFITLNQEINVNDLPKYKTTIIKILNRTLDCLKEKSTVSSHISMSVFTILYPPKAIGFSQTVQGEKTLQEQKGQNESTQLLHVS